MKTNEILYDTVLEVVENQIRDLHPPATKETFDRLVAEGHDADEARRLIGCVVVSEIFDIQEEGAVRRKTLRRSGSQTA